MLGGASRELINARRKMIQIARVHRMAYKLRIVMRRVRTVSKHFHVSHNCDSDSNEEKTKKLRRNCHIVNKRSD